MTCFRDKFIDKRELLITEMERAAHTLEVEDAEDFGVGEWRQSSCIEGRDDTISWNNGKEVPRWGVAEIQKMNPSTTGRCYCCP